MKRVNAGLKQNAAADLSGAHNAETVTEEHLKYSGVPLRQCLSNLLAFYWKVTDSMVGQAHRFDVLDMSVPSENVHR